jgi:mono/diheme cytochrome c family protein
LKKVLVTISVLLIALALSACSDNSIDTRVALDDAGDFPIDVTDERVAAGEGIYSTNCASCHGPVNGPVAVDVAPIHSDAGHTWHHPDRLLFQWVLDGPPLATIMPAFRGTLSDEEVVEVLAYIKSHWQPAIQERQRDGSAQYEAQIGEFGMK